MRFDETEPDDPVSVDDEPLTPYENHVKRHWIDCYAPAVERLRAAGGEAGLDQAVRNATHRARTLAAAEAKLRFLSAQLKWRYADPGTVGISSEEFLARRPRLEELLPFDEVKDPGGAGTGSTTNFPEPDPAAVRNIAKARPAGNTWDSPKPVLKQPDPRLTQQLEKIARHAAEELAAGLTEAQQTKQK